MQTNELNTALEQRMAALGERRTRQRIEMSTTRGVWAETPAGVILTKKALGPAIKMFSEWHAKCLEAQAQYRQRAAVALEGVDPALAMYVAVRQAINSAVSMDSTKYASLQIGNALATEMIATQFEEANGPLYRAVVRNARARGLGGDRQGLSVKEANKWAKVVSEPWDSATRLQIGMTLLGFVTASTNILKVDKIRDGKKTKHRLILEPSAEAWADKFHEGYALTRPVYMPLAIQPKPWTTVDDGGFHDLLTFRQKVITRSFPGQLDALKANPPEDVYEALNHLQGTAWAINTRVLDVMAHAWDEGLPFKGIPEKEDQPLLVPSPEVDASPKGSDLRKEFRRKQRAIHDHNAEQRSLRFEFARALNIAEEYRSMPFYYAYRMDFRGRVYATGTTLNPQGPDAVRGLLQFHEGVKLGPHGKKWLAIHGANLFGFDKVSFQHRVLWAIEKTDMATAVALDPLANRWWTEADKPWQFLAWCFEWAGLCLDERCGRKAENVVSHMAIAMDGSCNGIQHFSAMLRDEVGGAAVNLIPSDKPQDIYGRVAERTIERLRVLSQEDSPEAWIADAWIRFGVDRKTVKRQVMVLPYGGTFRSCLDYTRDAFKERISKGADNPFGDETEKKPIPFLAKVIWEAIGDVVIAARTAMSWLQQVARVATKHGKKLEWLTPSGLTVYQDYREMKTREIKTRFLGSLVYATLDEATDKLAGSRQVTSVAPNFVHSLDAAALVKTVNRSAKNGVTAWMMIHDSYGTHAGRTEILARDLRACFVQMYEHRDVLAEFLEGVKASLPVEAHSELPDLPAKGNLDIRDVYESQYFFA
jgi:DNA-directed RNA polymerase